MGCWNKQHVFLITKKIEKDKFQPYKHCPETFLAEYRLLTTYFRGSNLKYRLKDASSIDHFIIIFFFATKCIETPNSLNIFCIEKHHRMKCRPLFMAYGGIEKGTKSGWGSSNICGLNEYEKRKKNS